MHIYALLVCQIRKILKLYVMLYTPEIDMIKPGSISFVNSAALHAHRLDASLHVTAHHGSRLHLNVSGTGAGLWIPNGGSSWCHDCLHGVWIMGTN